jgi:hypothetical protein
MRRPDLCLGLGTTARASCLFLIVIRSTDSAYGMMTDDGFPNHPCQSAPNTRAAAILWGGPYV